MEMDERMINRRMNVMRDEQWEMLKKHGWIVHFVFETEKKEFDGLANIHTHGLPQSFHHPDLQIVLPIDPRTAHAVLTEMVEQIKQGRQFHPNERYDHILEEVDVYFVESKEEGRTVLRAIIPDAEGRFPFDEGCDEVYNRQMEELPTDETGK